MVQPCWILLLLFLQPFVLWLQRSEQDFPQGPEAYFLFFSTLEKMNLTTSSFLMGCLVAMKFCYLCKLRIDFNAVSLACDFCLFILGPVSHNAMSPADFLIKFEIVGSDMSKTQQIGY